MQGGDDDLSIQQLSSNLSTYKQQLQQIKEVFGSWLMSPVNMNQYLNPKRVLISIPFSEQKASFSLSDDALLKCVISGIHSGGRNLFSITLVLLNNLSVRRLLHDDPGNSEYEDMEKVLAEVIVLTEELLETAKQSEKSGLTFGGDADISLSLPHSGGSIPQYLDSDNISDHKFPVRTKIQAVWSEDGEWYNATIEALTPNGYFVSYDGWGNKEEVDPANVRLLQEGAVDALLEAEKEAGATKLALKRKIAPAATASSDFQSRSLPAKLRIQLEDPEDVKATKRKKIHAFKSKMRKEELETTQNKRQNAWQQFQTSKGRAKKIGFFTGRKKESIFKSPDDPFGKVGVIGSGKGLTDFQRQEKHLHLKGTNAESMI